MPPESVKTARIRGSKARNESGSVSPSALSDPGRGKMIFAEKMRNMYGNQDPKELEIKIEQLWNGLTPLQREKFIGVSGEKENVKVKSEVPNAKPVVPILERRNNCKAIAKVLDLKVTKPMTPYADLVKNRISSVWKEGSVDNFRQAKISPLSLLTCSTTVQTPPPSPPNDTEFDDMPMTKSEVVKPKDTPKKATFKMPSLNLSAPPKKGTFKTVTRKFVVKKVQKPIGPRISYEKACQEYYKALSQSFLVDNYATDTTMLPIYADIIEGCQPIREYTFGGLL
ncbi:unnamed protein product [Caenorhabditis brenneri]